VRALVISSRFITLLAAHADHLGLKNGKVYPTRFQLNELMRQPPVC
jgi:hypothetical protein